jgi:hypothetical protein
MSRKESGVARFEVEWTNCEEIVPGMMAFFADVVEAADGEEASLALERLIRESLDVWAV